MVPAYPGSVAANLEYLGNYLNLENSWNSQEFCATSEKNYNKKNFNTIKYLCKTAVDWVNRIFMISVSSDLPSKCQLK